MEGISETDNSGIVVTEKKRGRPRTGKVLFAKRVPASMIPELMAVVSGGLAVADATASVVPEAAVMSPSGPRTSCDCERLRKENAELVASNKILMAMSAPDSDKDAKMADLEELLQKTARMTDDAKCQAWIRKYDALLAEFRCRVGDPDVAQ
jgi:hypothetical protein